MALDTATPESNMMPLSPEHKIIKKYLECGSWQKAGTRPHIGKRTVQKILEFHMAHCVFEVNLEHDIVFKYLECRNIKDTGIHRHELKRQIQKVLRFHMVHCLHIMQESKQEIKTRLNQRILFKCPVCAKEMMVTPYWSKRRKYCSYQCYSSVPRKRKPTSEKRKFRMSPGWRQTRTKCISNFGQMCPITLETESLDVHHIDLDWSNNEPENLIPLWRPLHRLITARANYDSFYEALDRNILLSITSAWRE